MWQMRNAYKGLVRKPEVKRLLRRRKDRWQDNIRMDIGEIVRAVWTGDSWLRIGTSGGLLLAR
jgi:hypothetical protein